MNTELLKEAVGYLGWQATSSYFAIPNLASLGVHPYDWEALPDLIKDHLARRLIDQVDTMGTGAFHAIERRGSTEIIRGYDLLNFSSGPNRNENSIRACVEFMRGRG